MQRLYALIILRLALWLGVVLLFVCVVSVHAATYFLAPNGSDSGTGTSSDTPWKTFNFAKGRLQPGDTLLLMDGTYTEGANGHIDFHCDNGSVRSGLPNQRITLKAQHERQARVLSNGASPGPFGLWGCDYWTVEGLHIEVGDFKGQSDGSIMILRGTAVDRAAQGLVIRRNLLTRANRWTNNSGVGMRISNSLVEENEMYYFHRHGFQLLYGDNNIFRRNYANSRAYADIPGGYPSAYDAKQTGDGAYAIYGTPASHNNLYENNISEGNGMGFLMEDTYSISYDTRILGHISFNDLRGLISAASPSTYASNLLMQDFVTIQPKELGILLLSAKASCRQCTVLGPGATDSGFYPLKHGTEVGDGRATFLGDNLLVTGLQGTGIKVGSTMPTWKFSSTNSHSNGTNYAPGSSGNYANQQSFAAQLGTCKVWIPDSSPLKKAGTNGQDIGANILFRYQDGTLTQDLLWDRDTGQFPCGATVRGVNDTDGNSCINVHLRLNINRNGCPFPAAVGGGLPPKPPEPPQPPDVATLGTFYADASAGDDTVRCSEAQSLEHPRRTPERLLACGLGGSRFYFRQGTYPTAIDTKVLTIPSGPDADHPTIIASWPGDDTHAAETATLQIMDDRTEILFLRNKEQFIVFDRLVLDCQGQVNCNAFVTYPGVGPLTFQRSEVRGTYFEGAYCKQSAGIVLQGNTIHHASHGALIRVDGCTDTTIVDNILRDGSKEGIYGATTRPNMRTQIRTNTITNNQGAGIDVGPSVGEVVQDNTLQGNGVALQVRSGAQQLEISGNQFLGGVPSVMNSSDQPTGRSNDPEAPKE